MEYEDLQKSNPLLFNNENAPFRIVTDKNEITNWQEKRRSALIEKEQPLSWADIGVVLDDPYIIVIRDLVEFPSGYKGGYFRLINRADLLGGQGVVILPEYQDQFILIHRYRHATRSWHYEIPRGFGEPGTGAELQARKEIKEEIGGEIERIEDLGILHNNTGAEGNNVKLYFAKLNIVGKPEQDEAIAEVVFKSLIELEDMIANGRITDGFTIATYTRAKLRGLIG